MEKKDSKELLAHLLDWLDSHKAFKWTVMCKETGIDHGNFGRAMRMRNPSLPIEQIEKATAYMKEYGYRPLVVLPKYTGNPDVDKYTEKILHCGHCAKGKIQLIFETLADATFTTTIKRCTSCKHQYMNVEELVGLKEVNNLKSKRVDDPRILANTTPLASKIKITYHDKPNKAIVAAKKVPAQSNKPVNTDFLEQRRKSKQ